MKLTALILLVLLSFSCKKEPGSGDAVFYAWDANGWALIVDGKDYGQLTYSKVKPNCYSAGLQVLSLKEGEHTVDARSLSGLAWGHPVKFQVTADGCKTISLP